MVRCRIPGRLETQAWGFCSQQSHHQIAHRSGPTKAPSVPSLLPGLKWCLMILDTGNQCHPQQNGVQGAPLLMPASIKVWGRVTWLEDCGGCMSPSCFKGTGRMGSGVLFCHGIRLVKGALSRSRERSSESPDGQGDGKGPICCVVPVLSSDTLPAPPSPYCHPLPRQCLNIVISHCSALLTVPCHRHMAALPTLHQSLGYFLITMSPVAVLLSPPCHLLLSHCLHHPLFLFIVTCPCHSATPFMLP